MPAGLPVALILLAQASAYGPTAPEPPKRPVIPTSADQCDRRAASDREIVICAERPQGYRLDPDVMEARKAKREALAGRPKSKLETMRVSSCGVGPQPCGQPGIDLLSAAMTAVTMAKRLADGKEIGSMFETEPQSSEYQLYVEAKRLREAREAEAKAKAIVAEMKAKTAAQEKPKDAAPSEQ
jgi:hypothetical protein